jgi:hypothetical protein
VGTSIVPYLDLCPRIPGILVDIAGERSATSNPPKFCPHIHHVIVLLNSLSITVYKGTPYDRTSSLGLARQAPLKGMLNLTLLLFNYLEILWGRESLGSRSIRSGFL